MFRSLGFDPTRARLGKHAGFLSTPAVVGGSTEELQTQAGRGSWSSVCCFHGEALTHLHVSVHPIPALPREVVSLYWVLLGLVVVIMEI